jgi:hypothetical protein
MNVLLLGCLTFSFKNIYFNNINNNFNNNFNNNLSKFFPPVNNIYSANIKIPLIGNQNIEYTRTEILESKITLNGFINKIGYIYINKNNPYDYTFDDVLKKIVSKYKCEIYNPYYDTENDLVIFEIKIKLINFRKNITLKNNLLKKN